MSGVPHLPPVATRLCLETLPRREREIVAHLLACAACREALEGAAPGGPVGPDPAAAGSYDQVFDRVLARVREPWANAHEERRQAFLRLDELWARPRSQWRAMFAEPCSAVFLALALDQALEHAGSDPLACRRLGTLARVAAQRQRDLPDILRDELLGRSWTVDGSTHVLRREGHPADLAFARASRLLAACPNPLAEAEICRALAERSLRRGSSGEALALLARAARLAGESGDVEREVRDLERQAGILSDQADLEQAAGLLAAALLRAEDAGLASTGERVRLRLLLTLRALGRHDEAGQVALPAAASTPLSCSPSDKETCCHEP